MGRFLRRTPGNMRPAYWAALTETMEKSGTGDECPSCILQIFYFLVSFTRAKRVRLPASSLSMSQVQESVTLS